MLWHCAMRSTRPPKRNRPSTTKSPRSSSSWTDGEAGTEPATRRRGARATQGGMPSRGLRRLDHRERDLGLLALGRLVDQHRGAGRQLGPQDEVRERILDVALDRPAKRARAHRRVPALLDQEVLGLLGQIELELALG